MSLAFVSQAIRVDEEYEILNGFKGLLRDIILRLVNLVRSEDMKIRVIFGICGEQLKWRQGKHFLRILSIFPLPITFLTGVDHRNHVVVKGSTVEGNGTNFTVFVDKKMIVGVFKITCSVSGSILAARTLGLVSSTDRYSDGFFRQMGSCGLSAGCGFVGCEEFQCNALQYKGSQTVAMELSFVKTQANKSKTETTDLCAAGKEAECPVRKEGTLVFTVDGGFVRDAVIGITPSVYFAFVLYNTLLVEVQSFQHLQVPTSCKDKQHEFHEWM